MDPRQNHSGMTPSGTKQFSKISDSFLAKKKLVLWSAAKTIFGGAFDETFDQTFDGTFEEMFGEAVNYR